jgi:NADH-quinone oxidoreductase subunit C
MRNESTNDAPSSNDSVNGDPEFSHQTQTAPEVTESLLNSEGENMAMRLAQVLGERTSAISGRDDIPSVLIHAAALRDVAHLCKDDPRLDLKLLHCLFAVDYEDRIQVVYILFSMTTLNKAMIKVDLVPSDPVIDTVGDIWEAAKWFERETHDLFGVQFAGNSDMSPLLLYEGFDGHPGLKSYPLNDYDEY